MYINPECGDIVFVSACDYQYKTALLYTFDFDSLMFENGTIALCIDPYEGILFLDDKVLRLACDSKITNVIV